MTHDSFYCIGAYSKPEILRERYPEFADAARPLFEGLKGLRFDSAHIFCSSRTHEVDHVLVRCENAERARIVRVNVTAEGLKAEIEMDRELRAWELHLKSKRRR